MTDDDVRVSERGLVSMSEPAWEQARRRATVIGALAKTGSVSGVGADRAGEELDLSRRWVYEPVRRHGQGTRLVTDLAAGNSDGGRGNACEPEAVIRDMVRSVYLRRQRPTLAMGADASGIDLDLTMVEDYLAEIVALPRTTAPAPRPPAGASCRCSGASCCRDGCPAWSTMRTRASSPTRNCTGWRACTNRSPNGARPFSAWNCRCHPACCTTPRAGDHPPTGPTGGPNYEHAES